MTNHPNRSKITQAAWLEASDNGELVSMAGDIAWDAIAGYWDARDMPRASSAARCKEIAADEAYKARRGWEYAAADVNDPAGDLAKRVLATLGFRICAGTIGFDAVVSPI